MEQIKDLNNLLKSWDLSLMYKNEAQATAAHMKWLRQRWLWVYKIQDVGVALKPFDAVGCDTDWRFLALEYKICKTKKEPTKEWIFKQLRPHQITSLKAVAQTGGTGMVITYRQAQDMFIHYNIMELLPLEK